MPIRKRGVTTVEVKNKTRKESLSRKKEFFKKY